MVKEIKSKIQNREISVGIIGLGYVGLPLVIRFTESRFKTYGFDIDKDKIKKLKSQKSYISHINNSKISKIIKKGFSALNNFQKIKNCDVIIICVPTPLGVHKEPDLSYIKNTLEQIKPYLRPYQLLVLESTTYPGTTEEEIIPFISRAGFNVGEDYFVGYSPEREDPGNQKFTTKNIPKVVSGFTKNCLDLTKTLYDQIIDKTIPVSSPKVAEMTKILENIHRAVNIGLANELKIVANKMNIDIYEVINAAATKPFGFTPYYPGPGLGGHCIPIDPFYLTWKAKEIGMNTRFIELAGEINTSMPSYVIQKVVEALNFKGKSIKGSKILVMGISYKKNVDDTRESPALLMIDNLMKMGANVKYSDPYFSKMPKTRKYNFNLKNVKLNKSNIKSFDLILLVTDHDDFDYSLLKKEAKLIVDTRGRLKVSKNVLSA